MYLINCFTKLIDLASTVARMAGNAHRYATISTNTEWYMSVMS